MFLQLQVKMPKFLLNTLQPSENPAADVPPFAPLRYKAEGSPHRSHKLLLGSAGGHDIELFPSRAARLGRAMAREEEIKATATVAVATATQQVQWRPATPARAGARGAGTVQGGSPTGPNSAQGPG